MKVTVLTAVYNAEKYLRPCLDSLVSQTLSDVQFICIMFLRYMLKKCLGQCLRQIQRQ